MLFGLIRLRGLGNDHHHRRRLEIWDLVVVVTLEECNLPCAVEFERCRENRFVVRWFVPRHSGEISWEGDVDVVLGSEHLQLSIFVAIT